MTYIYGMVSRPGQADPESLQVLKEDLQRYPTDGHVAFCEGVISGGLFYQNLRKPPFPSEQPIIDKDSGIIIFASARLDYRLELLRNLGLDSSQLNKRSDTDLILRAYLKWGENCPNYLEGDFSFFIWDPSKQYLWGARDPLGFKPLFFSIDNETCYFSSHTTGLSKIPGVDKRPDQEFFANRLLNAECSILATPYRGVQQVPVGHSIKIDQGKASISKYFHWQTVPTRKKRSSEDYATELTKLLTEAVETRLYPDYPVGGFLSGGLDSSAVLAITQSLLDQKGLGRNIITASSVHAENSLDPNENERPWVDLFKKHFPKTELNYCTLQDVPPIFSEDAELFVTHRFRKYPTKFMNDMMANKLMEAGCRTYFSGWRGDHFISRHGAATYSELLKRGQFGKFVRAIMETAPFLNRSPKSLLRAVVLNNIPRKSIDPKLFYGVTFLNKEWKELVWATTKIKSQQRFFWPLYDLNDVFIRVLPDQQGTFQYYEDTSYRDKQILTRLAPLSDPRIINFALQLPAEEFLKEGMDRSTMRRALKDLLPDELRLRSTKGNFMGDESAICANVHEQWLSQKNIFDMVDNSPMAAFIDKDAIKKYIALHKKHIEIGDVEFRYENAYFLNLLGILFYFHNQN
jgi:asparagine synthase (glutamine-hydrolysing)